MALRNANKLLESRSPEDVTSRANTLASRIATTKDFQGAGSKRGLGSILVADAILRPHMGIKYPLFDVLAHFIQAVRK